MDQGKADKPLPKLFKAALWKTSQLLRRSAPRRKLKMLDSCVSWQMARLSRVLPSRSRFIFAVQDPTGAPPLTLQTLFLLHLLIPRELLLLFRKVFKLSIDETVLKKNFACCNFDGEEKWCCKTASRYSPACSFFIMTVWHTI